MNALSKYLFVIPLFALTACVDDQAVKAEQIREVTRLSEQNRDLKIAVDVVVNRLRQVDEANELDSLEPLGPQIYQLATALLPGGAPSNVQVQAQQEPNIRPVNEEALPASDPFDGASIMQASLEQNGPNGYEMPPNLGQGRSLFLALHLGSYRTQERAFAGWRELQAKAPETFEGLRPRLEQVDLGERGVFLRLKAGPLRSEDEVQTHCDALSRVGIYCSRTDFTGFEQS